MLLLCMTSSALEQSLLEIKNAISQLIKSEHYSNEKKDYKKEKKNLHQIDRVISD